MKKDITISQFLKNRGYSDEFIGLIVGYKKAKQLSCKSDYYRLADTIADYFNYSISKKNCNLYFFMGDSGSGKTTSLKEIICESNLMNSCCIVASDFKGVMAHHNLKILQTNVEHRLK